MGGGEVKEAKKRVLEKTCCRWCPDQRNTKVRHACLLTFYSSLNLRFLPFFLTLEKRPENPHNLPTMGRAVVDRYTTLPFHALETHAQHTTPLSHLLYTRTPQDYKHRAGQIVPWRVLSCERCAGGRRTRRGVLTLPSGLPQAARTNI